MNIAILTGGNSAERVVSHKSSAIVEKHLSKNPKFRCFQIDIHGTKWLDLKTGVAIDRNDFSLEIAGERIRFDHIFASLHGSPLEDGKLQGYFDVLGIPYTCCSGFVSALLMNKFLSKTIARPYGIPMAKSVLLLEGAEIDLSEIESYGLPVFVKPNKSGSSFGVSKVETFDQLMPAIEAAFVHDTEVVVESFLSGREFSNGVFKKNGEIVVLPITEIIPDEGWFDFAAKYEGKSHEVTPAEITAEQTVQCQATSKRLYEIFDCRGAVRFDYIIHNGQFCFLEGNTIPGLTEASLIPQQATAAGYTLTEFFTALVESTVEG